MPHLASHLSAVPESGTRRIFELARSVPDAIMLCVGEPHLPVPHHIAEAARQAWDRDDTDYAPNGGLPGLRRAIVDKLARENRVEVDAERVWVTVGGTQALAQAFTLALGDGDEVLIPDPGYTTFDMYPRSRGALPVPYGLHPEHGFAPSVDELERLVTGRTRAIVINSPSNPLGVVYGEPLIAELVDFAARHDLWVISDEVYEDFTWEIPHTFVLAVAAARGQDDRILSVFSLSKTHAMTGVRVGWLVTPAAHASVMRALQEATIASVAMPDQYAAIAALTGPRDHVDRARAQYRATTAAATEALTARGLRFQRPQGAFYLWVDVSHATGGDVAVWAERFLWEQGVAVAPGAAFGRRGEGWIRLCLAARLEDVLTGIERLPAP